MTQCRRNPLGRMGLRCISSSLVVADVPASPPSRSSTCPRKPHPRDPTYYSDRLLTRTSHTQSTPSADLAASTARPASGYPRPASGCPWPPQRTAVSTLRRPPVARLVFTATSAASQRWGVRNAGFSCGRAFVLLCRRAVVLSSQSCVDSCWKADQAHQMGK